MEITTRTTDSLAWHAPIADSRSQSYLNQRERVFELRASVARHPDCRLRAANLARAEDELVSRHAEAYPDREGRVTDATLRAVLAELRA